MCECYIQVEFFRHMDDDGNGRISQAEFRGAMALLGLIPQGDPHAEGLDLNKATAAVDALFRMMDSDRSGYLEYRELNDLLRKAESRLPKPPTKEENEERQAAAARAARLTRATSMRKQAKGVSLLNRRGAASNLLAEEAARGALTGETMQTKLRNELVRRWARVRDLLTAWDTDNDGRWA
jgi:hypothetical protein